MDKRTIRIGLVGCGTVGMGVIKIFQKNLALLEEKAGAKLELTWACDMRKRPLPSVNGKRIRFTNNWKDLVNDPSLDIVIELIGGYEPARTIVLAALRAGKHVTTANKALLAKYWEEVFSVARDTRTLVYFEAAVAAGVPVIQGLNEGLAANRIEKIYGILNGTTNYILTRMTREGMEFDVALKAAQEAGFAEADPSFDIEGVDAAHKLAILASLGSGAPIPLSQVYREGIVGLDVWDVIFAQGRLGYTTKLLGIAEMKGGRFSARVHPTLIPSHHPFATVGMEYNAIFVHGDAAGDIMFYGKGAGQMAAASAVVSDVVYLARQVAYEAAGQVPYVTLHPERRLKPIPFKDIECRHYLRFITRDRPGVLSRIAGLLARFRVSIASVYQKEAARPSAGVPIVVVTHRAPNGAVQSALKAIDSLPFVRKKSVHLRMEDLQ